MDFIINTKKGLFKYCPGNSKCNALKLRDFSVSLYSEKSEKQLSKLYSINTEPGKILTNPEYPASIKNECCYHKMMQ